MIAIERPKCTGCGTCALVCPHRVIDIVEGQACLTFEDRCIECGACQLNCRENAISVTKGTGCLIAIAKEVWFRGRKGCKEDGSYIEPNCGCG